MPSLNFMLMFAGYVRNGTKPGTIRAFRKTPIKPGDQLFLFTGLRHPGAQRLHDYPLYCTDVKTVFILPDGNMYEVNAMMDGKDAAQLLHDDCKMLRQSFAVDILTAEDRDALAWADGFRSISDPDDPVGCFDMMLHFWRNNHTLPFAGHHIFWK